MRGASPTGGLTRSLGYDQVGQLTALTYGGDVADVVANGDGTWTVTGYHQDSWVAWSRGYDGAGRLAQEWTPDAAAITGPAGVDQPSQIAPYDTGDALGYSRTYSYDRAGRLATVADRTATTTGVDVTTDPVGCQVRAYSFDVNGNRTALTRRAPATDGSCATAGGTTTSWVYDSADRLTSGYTYDAFGRATTIPGADTPNGSTAGALTLGYYDTEQVASMVQGASTSTYALDMAGRRSTSTATPIAGPGAPVTTMSRYYSDTGDNPAWTTTSIDAGPVSTTRYAENVAGDLGITITDGTVSVPVANPHGDIVTTIAVPATGDALTIGAWADYDEYGNPLPPAGATTAQTLANAATVAGPGGYGWVGAKQRATNPTTGLILMGARVYNTVTGAFTSRDPVYGGNTTAYTYPQDPTNGYDLTGQWGWDWLATAAKVVGVVAAGVCIVASAGACAVAGAIALGASAAYHGHAAYTGQESWSQAAYGFGFDAVTSIVPGLRFARYATRGLGSQLNLVGRHAAARLSRFGRSLYSGRHSIRGGFRTGFGRGFRHSVNRYRGNWTLHPYRSSIRHAVQWVPGMAIVERWTMTILQVILLMAMGAIAVRRAQILWRFRRGAGPPPSPYWSIVFYCLTGALVIVIVLNDQWPLLWYAITHGQ
jgi:RHS repeat-associated protein